MNIILLSGGSGKRLWPLSNENNSKQFLRLLRNDKGEKESMLQRIFRQIKENGIKANIIIATRKSQVDLIKAQLGENVDIVVEPESRNTFPAILLACAFLKYKKNISIDDSVLVLPVDPYTENAYFKTLIKMNKAIKENKYDLTLMGIKPTYPSEKYGYIICDYTKNKTKKVTGFFEKPTLENAKKLLKKEAYWNAGVFGFKLKYLMGILDNTIKVNSFEELYSRYKEIKKNSFDYEVVEKAKSINMIPFDGKWKDLGTWNTITEEIPKINGNVVVGENNENVSVINVSDKPIVVLGMKDTIIVSSVEGTLVSNKEKSSYLKQYVDQLDEKPLFERKKWGEFKEIDQFVSINSNKSSTKHLYIKAGYTIDSQNNNILKKIWIVIDGQGTINMDDKEWFVKTEDVVNISNGENYQLYAITDLHLIEIAFSEEINQQKTNN